MGYSFRNASKQMTHLRESRLVRLVYASCSALVQLKGQVVSRHPPQQGCTDGVG